MGLYEQRAILLRGDPGLWGRMKKAAKGFLTGGPIGAVVGFATGGPTPSTGPPTRLPLPGESGIPRPGGGYVPFPEIPMVGPVLTAAAPQVAGPGQLPPLAGAVKPSGYHANKSGYWTKEGYVAKGTRWVRNRTRNISNGRANTRAMSRLSSWDKADRKRRTLLKKMAR